MKQVQKVVAINSIRLDDFCLDKNIDHIDILKIDVGAYYAGFIGDSAWTFAIGKVSPQAQKLMSVTAESLRVGIEKAVAGGRLWDMIAPIQEHVEANGLNVVREYQGHGVGRQNADSLPEQPL
jgi:methionyl aminopeptidase